MPNMNRKELQNRLREYRKNPKVSERWSIKLNAKNITLQAQLQEIESFLLVEAWCDAEAVLAGTGETDSDADPQDQANPAAAEEDPTAEEIAAADRSWGIKADDSGVSVPDEDADEDADIPARQADHTDQVDLEFDLESYDHHHGTPNMFVKPSVYWMNRLSRKLSRESTSHQMRQMRQKVKVVKKDD